MQVDPKASELILGSLERLPLALIAGIEDMFQFVRERICAFKTISGPIFVKWTPPLIHVIRKQIQSSLR